MRRPPLRIIVAGTPAPAVPSLLALAESGHEIVAVVSRPDAPVGRGRTLTPSAVSAAALDLGLPLLRPVSARDPEFLAALTELAPDAAAVVAYGQLLRPAALAIPTHGWVNLHFSLLPAWRGAAPVQAAVRAGDDVTGATTFRLDEGLDTGPVFGTVTESVRPDDTSGALLERLSVSGARLLVATMDGIADGSLTPVPQPGDGVSLAPKITPDDARIRWSDPAFAVDRMIRSMTPQPGAWTESKWGKLILGPVVAVEAETLPPGEIVVERKRVLVGTGTGVVQLGTVKAPGKKEMPATDWARGARPEAGAMLGVSS